MIIIKNNTGDLIVDMHDIKGKAKELKGKTKGKITEEEGKAKGKMAELKGKTNNS